MFLAFVFEVEQVESEPQEWMEELCRNSESVLLLLHLVFGGKTAAGGATARSAPAAADDEGECCTRAEYLRNFTEGSEGFSQSLRFNLRA
jgi:hypothetical protein